MIDEQFPPVSDLCADNGPPSSLEIWLSLQKCVCEVACPQCESTWCIDPSTASMGCSNCLSDIGFGGACGAELNTCFEDFN